jgi:hypothetical protein
MFLTRFLKVNGPERSGAKIINYPIDRGKVGKMADDFGK